MRHVRRSACVFVELVATSSEVAWRRLPCLNCFQGSRVEIQFTVWTFCILRRLSPFTMFDDCHIFPSSFSGLYGVSSPADRHIACWSSSGSSRNFEDWPSLRFMMDGRSLWKSIQLAVFIWSLSKNERLSSARLIKSTKQLEKIGRVIGEFMQAGMFEMRDCGILCICIFRGMNLVHVS